MPPHTDFKDVGAFVAIEEDENDPVLIAQTETSSVLVLEKTNAEKQEVSTEESSPTDDDNNKHTTTTPPAEDDDNTFDPLNLGWWKCGGMHITVNVGFAVIVLGSVYMLIKDLPTLYIQAYCSCVIGCVAMSVYGGMKTAYCFILVPIYLTSLMLAPTLDMNTIIDTSSSVITNNTIAHFSSGLLFIVVSMTIAIAKVNICMSVCLHRYAAHNAFKCGPITAFFVNILGCCAMQGGPLWWAAEHRCHHRHCDERRDPHSPTMVGVEKAFAFFQFNKRIEEEYVPRHMEGAWNRFMDTWCSVFVMGEMIGAYYCGGREGLFVAYTSGWICQCITLWFNVVNHPPAVVATNAKTGKVVACKASDDFRLHDKTSYYYVPFHFLDLIFPLFATFVMEGEHKHHHEHAMLAKRSWYDPAYWCFIKPLEVVGLVWDVQI